jgi:hypothetical protein
MVSLTDLTTRDRWLRFSISMPVMNANSQIRMKVTARRGRGLSLILMDSLPWDNLEHVMLPLS